jgi:cytochrome c
MAFVAVAATPGSNNVDATDTIQTNVHTDLTAEERPCARTEFKTTLVKDACKEGGQKAAKKAMQNWVKENKAKYKEKAGKAMNCKTCHTKFGGDFPLNADGLKIYQEYGGK